MNHYPSLSCIGAFCSLFLPLCGKSIDFVHLILNFRKKIKIKIKKLGFFGFGNMVINDKKSLLRSMRDYLSASERLRVFDSGTCDVPVVREEGIEVKIVQNAKEFFGALRLGYDVYFEEFGHYGYEDLSALEHDLKIVTDDYDFLCDTVQIVAKAGDDVVGRVRIIDGQLPIAKYVDLKKYSDKPLKEASRLMIARDFRNSQSILAMMGYLYKVSRRFGQIFCSSFDEGRQLYLQIGAEEIGEFRNLSFSNAPLSCAFRIDFDNFSDSYMFKPDVSRYFVERAIGIANYA
jgi:hypothetical protein